MEAIFVDPFGDAQFENTIFIQNFGSLIIYISIAIREKRENNYYAPQKWGRIIILTCNVIKVYPCSVDSRKVPIA